MLYLILGIVLGAAFHEFWIELFNKVQNKVNQWLSPKSEEAVDANFTSEPTQTEK